MKKFITSIVFFFIFSNTLLAQEFWSNKNDGPRTTETAKQIFSGKKLDYIEGIWFDDQLGTVVIFKDNDIYKMYIISGSTDFDGTWEASFIKRGERQYDFFQRVWYSQTDGSYKFDTQAGKVNALNNHFYTRYDSTSNQGVDMDSKYTRVWPQDLNVYNNNVKSTEGEKTNNTQSDKSKKFYELNWYNLDDPKNHYTEIPGSNSTVNILETEIYLKGQKDIDEYSNLLFGDGASQNKMLILDEQDFQYSIYVDYINDGYVSLDDWKDINSEELLTEMKNTAKEDVMNIQWVIKPKISSNNHITYSYKVLWKDKTKTVETLILALGKKGYNNINFVTKLADDFSANDLEKMALEFANSIKFKEGFRYSDYKQGDKLAAVGIGGLIAGTLGIKALAKVGILAKFLPFLAKFWWIIFAPIVAIFGLFGNKDKEDAPIKKKRTRPKKKD